MVMATTTPLPAAKPSAFTTIGAPVLAMNCFASSASKNTPYAAVGILYFFIRSLANTLDPSSWAAALDGPNTGIPASFNTSASPATRGASGPTTTRSTLLSFKKRIR